MLFIIMHRNESSIISLGGVAFCKKIRFKGCIFDFFCQLLYMSFKSNDKQYISINPTVHLCLILKKLNVLDFVLVLYIKLVMLVNYIKDE